MTFGLRRPVAPKTKRSLIVAVKSVFFRFFRKQENTEIMLDDWNVQETSLLDGDLRVNFKGLE